MRRRETIVFVLILLAATFVSRYFVAHPLVASDNAAATADDRSKLAALIGALESSPIHLDVPTRNSECVLRGPLPDHGCTPGAIFQDTATSTICTSGYTKTVRNVPVRVKRQVYANYGIPYPQPSGTYELDHLIPLELGGNNSVANLFPEAATPSPGFHEKDVVENYLHERVCARDVSLAAAQEQIADDWKAVYDLLGSSTVQRLEAKYKNWAD